MSTASPATAGTRHEGGPGGSAPRKGEPDVLTLRQRLGRWDVKVSPYLYISPFFLLFLVVGLGPLAFTAYVSVHEWDLLSGKGEFTGLENYRDVLGDRYFWKALQNTISIFLLSSAPQVVLALCIAALLDANLRGKTWWRMGVLIPFVVAPVAAALIFGNLFGDRYGLINEGLRAIGLEPIRWHVDRLASHVAIATMVNWRWTGYNALIFLAAMQAIPRDVYEAAAIDGAGKIRQFFSVTLPMLRPTVIFVVVTSTIGGLQIFAEPRMFDAAGLGGADRQYQTITMYLWELGWRVRNLGTASAVAWLLFGLIVLVALVNLLLIRRLGREGGGAR
ncbi:MAG TPA: sugar ABC transporter permease [Nocardioidaceae bacterium]|nr:sugar ABC transporter permease [Nocardioidaceae bacterium]